MAITLYKAAEQVQNLLNEIDLETGELPVEYGSAVQLVKERAGAVAAAIVSARIHRDAVKAHVESIRLKIKEEETKEQRWLDYLVDGMKTAGITKIMDESGVTLVERWPERDESVDVFQPELLQPEYLRVKPAPPPEPNKAVIKAALKAGLGVIGARLVKSDRIKVGL